MPVSVFGFNSNFIILFWCSVEMVMVAPSKRRRSPVSIQPFAAMLRLFIRCVLVRKIAQHTLTESYIYVSASIQTVVQLK